MINGNDHQCIDGRCPVGIDSVKKIGLTPQEKRTIFFYLKKEMKKSKFPKMMNMGLE